MTASSEATQEIDSVERGHGRSTSFAGDPQDLFAPDGMWAGGAIAGEGVLQNRSSRFFRYFEFFGLLAILGAVCLGGVGAVIRYENYDKVDPSSEMTRRIDEVASNLTALEERVATMSEDQVHRETTLRDAIGASESGVQRTFGTLSDRLDRVRAEAEDRDAQMALRLDSLETKAAAPVAPPATPEPAEVAPPREPAAAVIAPSVPVAAVSAPSPPVAAVKRVAKFKKRRLLRHRTY